MFNSWLLIHVDTYCKHIFNSSLQFFTDTIYIHILSTYIIVYIYLGQQTSRKKRLFWSMTLFLANWPILGQIGQFNPNDPKWLKSNFVCVSVVSHPITSLCFTIATLVALIDPWRVWLDPWGLRFQAWAPAMLCLLFFAGVVHCSGIGCQLAEISMLYDTCCSDSGSQICTIWDSCVFVCVWDFTHTTI